MPILAWNQRFLLNQEFRWRGLARALIHYCPWALSSVCHRADVSLDLDSNYGVSHKREFFMFAPWLVEQAVSWLADPDWPLGPFISNALTCRVFRFCAVMILAGLQSISKS